MSSLAPKNDAAILRLTVAVLKKRYGKKCKSYAYGCYTCSAWRLIDDLVCIAKDMDEMDK